MRLFKLQLLFVCAGFLLPGHLAKAEVEIDFNTLDSLNAPVQENAGTQITPPESALPPTPQTPQNTEDFKARLTWPVVIDGDSKIDEETKIAQELSSLEPAGGHQTPPPKPGKKPLFVKALAPVPERAPIRGNTPRHADVIKNLGRKPGAVPSPSADLEPKNITKNDVLPDLENIETSKTEAVIPEPQDEKDPEISADNMAEDIAEQLQSVEKETTEAAADEITAEELVEPNAQDVLAALEPPQSELQEIEPAKPSTEATDNKQHAGAIQRIFLGYPPDVTNPPENIESALSPDILAEINSRTDKRISIYAFATSESNSESDSRRIALARALALREFLVTQNIDAKRIDLHPMGLNEDPLKKDRIEIILEDPDSSKP